MPRLFLQEISSDSSIVRITGEKARYLSKVLRCKKGSTLTITDSRGNSFFAEIISLSANHITAGISGKCEINTESSLHIRLFQGVLKGAKMDLIIQKATELGVNEITPVITSRSQIRETRKLDRWKKIAEESSRQSCRKIVPEIFRPVNFHNILEKTDKKSTNCIFFWEKSRSGLHDILSSLRKPDDITLFCGPEGGFSDKEAAEAEGGGFLIASLGKRILRAETAAITAISIVQFVLGDVGH